MSLRYAFRLVAFGLLLATAGCAPTYLLGVQPAQPRTLFASGQPHAQATADSLSVALRFVGYEPEWLVFEAEYYNDSRRPVGVGPEGFAAVPARQAVAQPLGRRVRRGERVPAALAAASQKAPWLALPPAPLPALDPEPAIEQLQCTAATEAARASRPDWVGVALFAVALGADIAGATRARETYSQYQTRALLHDVAYTYNAISSTNRIQHAATAEASAQRAALLRDYALRRGQLQPGQQVRGYVYLPRFDAADGLRVLAPLGPKTVELDFVQTHQRR